jgi:hypothetical protein
LGPPALPPELSPLARSAVPWYHVRMNQTQAIAKFLESRASPDLAKLYSAGMEVQVNAAPDGGERVTGEFKGHSWQGWTDGKSTWKHVRIPYRAWDDPSYEPRKMAWSLDDHALAVGLTGWDWKERRSKFVTFDLDSVSNHVENALSDEEMSRVVAAVSAVPWATVRKSRSGKGHHVYVHLADSPEVANHGEHAAVARSILCLLSAASGLDMRGPVDCFGVVAWVWHREAGPGGFELVKQGVPLDRVPSDWKSHVDVVTRRRSRVATPAQVGGSDDVDALVRQLRRVPLDEDHKRLLAWFATQGPNCLWSWSTDLWMLTCHTHDLKRAHTELGLPGLFATSSTGKNLPDQNCFGFPQPNGVWQLRRHGKNVAEDRSWIRDPGGWTRCDFAAPATLDTSTRAHGGTMDLKGVCHFPTLNSAVKALDDIGVTIDPKSIEPYLGRKAEIHQSKNKLALRFKREGDETVTGEWVNRNGRYWESYHHKTAETKTPVETPDELIRAVVSNGADGGLYVWARDGWVLQPRANVVSYLTTEGITPADAQVAIGAAVKNYWRIVNKPFLPEYPGDREWNRNGAQLAFIPTEGAHPTWDMVLDHVGSGLDDAVKSHEWCQKAGIMRGREYLLAWCCSLFQYPTEPLPYLFLHSRAQQSGKSSLHEALGLLFKNGRGYANAKDALLSKEGFNGSLSGACLCYTEEIDLRRNKQAYNRIKEWTTGLTLSIRALYENVRDEANTTHWIQCANAANYCPVEAGDTRIVMVQVPALKNIMPKRRMLDALRDEAPAFMHTLLNTAVPETDERLRIPAIDSAVKEDQMDANMTRLDWFLQEFTEPTSGMTIPWSEFFDKFLSQIELSQRVYWSLKRVRSELSADYPRGKYGKNGDIHLGNLRWKDTPAELNLPPLARDLKTERLVRV